MSINRNNLVFIISNARSGSTMLRQMLNTHKAIGIPEREYGSLLSVLKNVDAFGNLGNRKNFKRFYNTHENLTTLDLRKGGFENADISKLEESKWFESLDAYDFQSVYTGLLYHHAKVFGKSDADLKWLGDKSPQHINDIKLLIKHFPKAKYILLTRHPIDIALSQDKFTFRHYNFISKTQLNEAWKRFSKKDNQLLLKRVGVCIKNITKTRHVFQEKDIDYIEVNYEEVLGDSNSFFKKVSSFLNIDDNFDLSKLRIKESQSGTKKGANELLVNNVNKYKSLMSDQFVETIENVYGEELSKATDKKSTTINLKNLNLKYSYKHSLNYIINIFLSFAPVIGVFKTFKLLFHKYILKRM